MPHSIAITTAQNVAIDYEVANLGDRILAFIIDGLIKAAYIFFCALLIVPQLSNADGNMAMFGVLGFILAIPMIFYTLLFEVFNDGQTPGKKGMNIKVVALDGEEVTTGMYFLRWLFRLIDINMMSGIIGILAIAFSEKGQRIGDVVAATSVISLKRRKQLVDTPYEKLELTYEPQYPSVNRLSTKDITTIKEILRNKTDDAYALKIQLSKKLEEVLDIEKNGSSEDFLKTVVKDYNYYNISEEY